MFDIADQIDVTEVKENNRLETLPKYFGRHFMTFEHFIYKHARNLSSDYCGGYWEFYTLSNGGFFMSLSGEMFDISVPGNGFSHTVDGSTFGIIVCLFALNHAAWTFNTAGMNRLYHLLLDYASQRPDAALIFRAID